MLNYGIIKPVERSIGFYIDDELMKGDKYG